jgi:serine protease Do
MNYDENDNQQPQNDGHEISNDPQTNAPQESPYVQPMQDNMAPYGSNMQNQWNYEAYQNAVNSKTKKKKNKGLMAFVITICSVFAVACLGLAGFGAYNLITQTTKIPFISANNGNSSSSKTQSVNNSGPSLSIANQPQTSTASTSSGAKTIQQVAKDARLSVVGIVTYSLQQMGELGEGSGIIMSADGYIITNNHVVSGASKIQVVLSDNTKYTAKVVGTDSRTDIAVLKIEAKNLKYATFGNSDQLTVGDSVLAIGNPGGLEFAGSVTEGIVSALNRTVSDSGSSIGYIQTDASINPGNSGGALVNMYGQVVGINAAKIADVDYEGIGFSIPIKAALPVINDLIKYGYVQNRVKLGITCSAFTADEAQLYNAQPGLLVASVDATSDAAKMGVQKNDIITKVNSQAVTATSDLLAVETKYKAGQSLTLTILRLSRDGTSKTFDVAVKLMEDRGTTATTDSSSSSSKSSQDPNGFFSGSQN